MKNYITNLAGCRSLAALSMLGLLSATSIFAQDENSEDEAIFELSPFEVTSSNGFQDRTTTSLTGVRQNLKDLPFSFEIFDKALIEEIGATDLATVLDFSTNASNSGAEESLQREGNFRGIATRFSRRNQYVWYNPSDSFSMGRAEIIRGPSSLLYGQSEPGGLVNFQTKQAIIGVDSNEVAIRVGDNNTLRGTFEVNKSLGKRGAFLVAGVSEDSDNWKENVNKDVEGIYFNARFKLTNKTNIKAEYENVDRDDIVPTTIISLDGVQLSDTPELFNDPDFVGGRLTRENAQSWSGLSWTRDRDWSNVAFGFDHEFNDHVAIDFGYNVQDQTTVNNQIAAGTGLVAPDLGNATTEDDDYHFQIRRLIGESSNQVSTARLRTLISFDIGELPQQIVIGGVWREDDFDNQVFRERLDNGNVRGGALRPPEIVNIANGPNYIFPEEITNPSLNPNPLGYVFKPNGFGTHTDETLKAGYAVWMGDLMKNRLKTVIGVRYDDLEKINTLNGTVALDLSETSSNAGFSYSFNDKVSAYVNYGESFKSQGSARRDPNNATLLSALGSGTELGVKFDILENKLSGLLTFFEADLDGDTTNLGTDTTARNAVDADGINGRNGGSFIPTNTETEGIELQFTANPTKNLTLSFGYGYNNATSKEDVVYQRLFNDAYLADANGNPVDANGDPLMRAGAAILRSAILLDANGNIRNARGLGLVGTGETGLLVNQVTGLPTDMVTLLNGGEKVAGRPEHNANLIGRYNFKEGRLKGFWLGGNLRVRWGYISGYSGTALADNRQLVTGEDQFIVGLNVGYRLKMEKVTWVSQLLVHNILDEEYAVGRFQAERFGEARNIQWTNTFRF